MDDNSVSPRSEREPSPYPQPSDSQTSVENNIPNETEACLGSSTTRPPVIIEKIGDFYATSIDLSCSNHALLRQIYEKHIHQQVESDIRQVIPGIMDASWIQEFLLAGSDTKSLQPTITFCCGDSITKEKILRYCKRRKWFLGILKKHKLRVRPYVALFNYNNRLQVEKEAFLLLSATHETLWGAGIACTKNGAQLCTLGGIIIIDGTYVGLTVRHAFPVNDDDKTGWPGYRSEVQVELEDEEEDPESGLFIDGESDKSRQSLCSNSASAEQDTPESSAPFTDLSDLTEAQTIPVTPRVEELSRYADAARPFKTTQFIPMRTFDLSVPFSVPQSPAITLTPSPSGEDTSQRGLKRRYEEINLTLVNEPSDHAAVESPLLLGSGYDSRDLKPPRGSTLSPEPIHELAFPGITMIRVDVQVPYLRRNDFSLLKNPAPPHRAAVTSRQSLIASSAGTTSKSKLRAIDSIITTDDLELSREADWALVSLANIDWPLLKRYTLPAFNSLAPMRGLLPLWKPAQGKVKILANDLTTDTAELSSVPISLKMGRLYHNVRLLRLKELLPSGTSGAWVSLDGYVCGHIIASRQDVPWAYMIPMSEVLDDIKVAFEAKDVSIPSPKTLLEWIQDPRQPASYANTEDLCSQTDIESSVMSEKYGSILTTATSVFSLDAYMPSEFYNSKNLHRRQDSSQNATIFQSSKYELYIRQQPKEAISGSGGHDQPSLDPPPVLQLLIRDFDPHSPSDRAELRSPPFAVHCRLIAAQNPWHMDGSTLAKDSEDSSRVIERNLLGTRVSGPFFYADDPDPENAPSHPSSAAVPPDSSSAFLFSRGSQWKRKEEASEGSSSISKLEADDKEKLNLPTTFFIFPDLSVRKAGEYRLEFTLMKVESAMMIPGASIPTLATVMSDVFRVVNARDFNQVQPSTNLVKGLLDRGAGLPLKVKRNPRTRRRVMRRVLHDDPDDKKGFVDLESESKEE